MKPEEFDNYDDLTVDEILDRAESMNAFQVHDVVEYEEENENRSGLINDLEEMITDKEDYAELQEQMGMLDDLDGGNEENPDETEDESDNDSGDDESPEEEGGEEQEEDTGPELVSVAPHDSGYHGGMWFDMVETRRVERTSRIEDAIESGELRVMGRGR